MRTRITKNRLCFFRQIFFQILDEILVKVAQQAQGLLQSLDFLGSSHIPSLPAGVNAPPADISEHSPEHSLGLEHQHARRYARFYCETGDEPVA